MTYLISVFWIYTKLETVSFFEFTQNLKRSRFLNLHKTWNGLHDPGSLWPQRDREYHRPEYHQWPCCPHAEKSVRITAIYQRRGNPAFWPGNTVYVESICRILWIRKCDAKHEQGRLPIWQRADGALFQHIEKWVHKLVWIHYGRSALSDCWGIRICCLQSCASP